MTPTDRRVDWDGVKRCLAILHRESRAFLGRSILIGGAACWFYRVQLQNAKNAEFPLPAESDAVRDLWLSKDIDFTGLFRGDAYEMLPNLIQTDSNGRATLQVAGIRLGFAQVGVTFDPEDVFQRARIAQFKSDETEIQFLVIDPVSLYREKQALSQKRKQPNDEAHFNLLKSYLAMETAISVEGYSKSNSVADQKRLMAFLIDVKTRAPEILQDHRVLSRREHVPELFD